MLQLENVTKTYNNAQQALDNINLTVLKGEKVGVLGPEGAGKSTLIRLINGVEQVSGGKIHRSMRVSWPMPFRKAFFQPTITGADNLRFICRVYNTPFQPALAFVKDFSELGNDLYKPVKDYPPGDSNARLLFSIFIAVDFDCYLLDEVIAVGNQQFKKKCEEELFGKQGRTIILASDKPGIVKKHCHRILVLDKGKLMDFADTNAACDYYTKEVCGK